MRLMIPRVIYEPFHVCEKCGKRMEDFFDCDRAEFVFECKECGQYEDEMGKLLTGYKRPEATVFTWRNMFKGYIEAEKG